MCERIAYIGIKGLPANAGADRVVEAIVQGMDKRHRQVAVYCDRREVPKGTRLPNIELIRIPTLPGKHLQATSLFLISALHALALGDYDLIHVHNVEACFVLPLLRTRYKVVATSHGRAHARDKWGKIAKMLITLTEYSYIYFSNFRTSVAQPLASYYEDRYHKLVHYLPNGVPNDIRIDGQGAAEILAKHGLEAGSYVMFAAGRIIPTKGCHFLLEALEGLDSDVSCLIVGDATHVPAYEKRLHRLAGDRVRFCSFISSKDLLFGLIRQARIFVFPSTYEAMSMMLLEVASVGTPIICSDIPENTSVLSNNAIFFTSGDVKDLQANLKLGLENPNRMKKLATGARNWVSEYYRWDDIVMEYERLYAAV